ncbi:hypothetical protein Bbelb_181840 [Branchiostoma belcheri]|nr:hypothetical protein Bbelb_181840 [Branchiostoma belcheri]
MARFWGACTWFEDDLGFRRVCQLCRCSCPDKLRLVMTEAPERWLLTDAVVMTPGSDENTGLDLTLSRPKSKITVSTDVNPETGMRRRKNQTSIGRAVGKKMRVSTNRSLVLPPAHSGLQVHIFKTEKQKDHWDQERDPGPLSRPYLLVTGPLTTCFRPHRTLRQLLVAPKDKTPKEDKCGVIYHISCQANTNRGPCRETYIGETERSLKTRFLEHRRPSSVASEVSQHIHIESPGHTVDLEGVRILDTEQDYFKRGIKEAIYIRALQPSLNRDGGRYRLQTTFDPLLTSHVGKITCPQHLERLRRILKIFWPNTISNKNLLLKTGLKPVSETLCEHRWRWLGHVCRKPTADLTRVALRWTPQGRKARGCPKETWGGTMEKEVRRHGFSMDEAVRVAAHRPRWRKLLEPRAPLGSEGTE